MPSLPVFNSEALPYALGKRDRCVYNGFRRYCDNDGWSYGARVGAGIGIAVAVVLIILLILGCGVRRRRRMASSTQPAFYTQQQMPYYQGQQQQQTQYNQSGTNAQGYNGYYSGQGASGGNPIGNEQQGAFKYPPEQATPNGQYAPPPGPPPQSSSDSPAMPPPAYTEGSKHN